jgi:hypothetical protein
MHHSPTVRLQEVIPTISNAPKLPASVAAYFDEYFNENLAGLAVPPGLIKISDPPLSEVRAYKSLKLKM